jgi:hypothetical protein
MSELSDLERAALRALPLTHDFGWFAVLKKRFKISHSNALHALNNTTFGWREVAAGVTVRSFAQEIIRLCDALETPYSPRDKMDCIWRNLDPGMRLHVPVPSATTVLSDWLHALDITYDNWKEQSENSLLEDDHRAAPNNAFEVKIKGGFLLPSEVRNTQILCNPPETPRLSGTYPSRSNPAAGLRRSFSSTH